LGFLLALISSIFNGVGIFLTKYISNDFHFSVAPYIMGYCYAFECLIILVFSEVGLCKLSFIPFLLTVILSVLFYLNLNFFIYGLAIGNAIKVLPVVYSGVIFNLVYNSFIFKQACDILDLVGSFTIVAVNVYKSVMEK
jgi:drug/metabolite transporter (DMT)-like permease